MNKTYSVQIALAIVAVVLLVGLLGSTYWQGLILLAIVFTIFGLSVNLVYGHLGYITFGHAAFLGLGAYTVGILNVDYGLNFWLATVVAVVPCALLGGLLAVTSMRLSGAYFAICSLTIAEVLRLVADSWISVTRGPLGIPVPRPTVESLADLGLSFSQYYLAITGVILALIYVAVVRLVRSPVGGSWRAIRESLDLSESIGIPSLKVRVQNLMISGALAGLAGALLLPRIQVLSPDLFSPYYSAIGLLIVVLGGRGTLLGPVLGGLVFSLLPEMLRAFEDYRMPLFAAIILIVVMVRPDGLAPLLLRWLPRRLSPLAHEPYSLTPVEADDRTHTIEGHGDLLEVKNLTKSFRGLVAVHDLSFVVQPGKVVGLMGPNGAGKTTSFSMISGFVAPTEGSIKFNGRSLAGLPAYKVSNLGLTRTFQVTKLFGDLSVFQNVLAATYQNRGLFLWRSIFRGKSYMQDEHLRRVKVQEALKIADLTGREDTLANSLPYGEQRLLAVAIALATSPTLLLLDEPAAGLNPTEAASLTVTLRRLRASGMSILLVEHNVRMLMSICDWLVVMHHGEKLAEGTSAEVRANELVKNAYFGTSTEK